MTAPLAESEALPESTPFEPIIVPCRHGTKHPKPGFPNSLWAFLVCWSDPYVISIMPTFWAVYGFVLLASDIGSDVWVSYSHLSEGHVYWGSLTITFIVLPMVFAQFYHAVYRKTYKWYQVHPFGLFYWYWKTIKTHRKQKANREVNTHEKAMLFVHYTHEVKRCEKLYMYISADETYLESCPELILQGYFMARLLSAPTRRDPEKDIEDLTLTMWISIASSVISLLSYESSVAYYRHYVQVLYEPSMLDIIIRITLDIMSLVPRLSAMTCYLTVEPKMVTVPVFLVLHFSIYYLIFFLTSRRHEFAGDTVDGAVLKPRSHEEFRGYRTNKSNTINVLRATLVSFLLPPTASWYEYGMHSGRHRPFFTKLWKGVHLQYILISSLQFFECACLVGVWMWFRYDEIKEFYRIFIPAGALGCLFIRPICDVLVQMLFLSPVQKDQETNCDLFKGVLAKTRLLQMGSDTVNTYLMEIWPRLQKLENLYVDEENEKTHAQADEHCQWIADHLSPEQVAQRQAFRRRSHKKKNILRKGIQSNPEPKTELLFQTSGKADLELFRRVREGAKRWQSTGLTFKDCEPERGKLARDVQDRVSLWQDVFTCCLNHQELPNEFIASSLSDEHFNNSFVADYQHMIKANKILMHAKPHADSK